MSAPDIDIDNPSPELEPILEAWADEQAAQPTEEWDLDSEPE